MIYLARILRLARHLARIIYIPIATLVLILAFLTSLRPFFWAPADYGMFGLTLHHYAGWVEGYTEAAYKEELSAIDCGAGCIGMIAPGRYPTNRRLKRVIPCNEEGKVITASVNNFGLRGRDLAWEERPIYVVGDSFVFGICVRDEHTIPSQLGNLTNRPVYNIGWPGIGPKSELNLLSYLDKSVPPSPNRSVVFVFYEGNDHELESTDILDLSREVDINKSVKYSAEFYSQPNPEDIAFRIRASAAYLSESLYGLKSRFFPSELLIDEQRISSELVNIIKYVGAGEISIAYMPSAVTAGEIYSGSTRHKYAKLLSLVKSTVEHNGVPFIDLTEVLRREKDPRDMYAGRVAHLNAMGYQNMARAIAVSLKLLDI